MALGFETVAPSASPIFTAAARCLARPGRCEIVDSLGILSQHAEQTIDLSGRPGGADTGAAAVKMATALVCHRSRSQDHTSSHRPVSEASLTRSLEEMGIVVPATLPSIIDTILAREFVFKRGNCVVPTGWRSRGQLLSDTCRTWSTTVHGQRRVTWTDQPGDRATIDTEQVLFGNGTPGLSGQLQKTGRRDRCPDIGRIFIGKPQRPYIFVRVAVWTVSGAGERRASLRDERTRRDDDRESREMLAQRLSEQPWGTARKPGKALYLKVGRFDPMVQRGGKTKENRRTPRCSRACDLKMSRWKSRFDTFFAARTGRDPERVCPSCLHGRFGPL